MAWSAYPHKAPSVKFADLAALVLGEPLSKCCSPSVTFPRPGLSYQLTGGTKPMWHPGAAGCPVWRFSYQAMGPEEAGSTYAGTDEERSRPHLQCHAGHSGP